MSATATLPPSVPTPPLMTAEEFLKLHGHEANVELVKGRVVRYPMPGGKHGKICGNAYFLIREAVSRLDLGHVMTNDTFVRTGVRPDSFRGANVCFLSYSRLPREQELPDGPIPTPDLVVEVRSPSDRMKQLTDKADEYVAAGVTAVVILDADTKSATVIRRNEPARTYSSDENLTLGDVLPGFAVTVRAFFE